VLQVTSSTNTAGLNGQSWYMQQASRAVNQALGRVIRHKFDYGSIILADERFAYDNQKKSLSKWVRPNIKVYTSFSDATISLRSFYRRAKNTPEWNRHMKNDNDNGSSRRSNTTTAASSNSSSTQNRQDVELMIELAGLNEPSTAAAALAMKKQTYDTSNRRRKNTSSSSSSSASSLFDTLTKSDVNAAMKTNFDNMDADEFNTFNNKGKKREMVIINIMCGYIVLISVF